MPFVSSRRHVHAVDLVRLGWGALLLAAPGALLRATGSRVTTTATLTARTLGARHVVQSLVLIAVSLRLPVPVLRLPFVQRHVRRAGAAVDALHAASGFAFAAAGRATKSWTADAVSASMLAVETWRSADRGH